MQIKIPLRIPHDYERGDYQAIKSALKQLELSVHHAQKAVENAEKDGIEVSQDSHIIFNFPVIKGMKQGDNVSEAEANFYENFWSDLQDVELEINLI